MHTEFDARHTLPQDFPMQSFAFAPPNLGVGDNKKSKRGNTYDITSRLGLCSHSLDYVFVDEHNRHKRLKGGGGTYSGLEGVLDFDHSSASGDDDHYGHAGDATQYFHYGTPSDPMPNPQGAYGQHHADYSGPEHGERDLNEATFNYNTVAPMPMSLPETYQNPAAFQPVNTTPPQPLLNDNSWENDHRTASDLSDVLGELNIKENGVALYISQQKKSLAEAPALEEFEIKLPSTATGSGSTVRIPQELMPSEEQCLLWFDYFFTHIHPYVPVLSKSYFHQQWRTNRKSISPLILEAIFACAGRMSNDPVQGAQWLALASKHEDCFMDVPRLSTIQALLLLLKAREAAPKRGYYYRSWMTVKTLVSMAKDLELHEHYADHQADRDCGHDPTECLIRTRIWQTIFVCEMMIGGPQGRFDMGVDPDTVDFEIPRAEPGVDSSDYQISRQFLYLVRNVRNVRHLHDTYGKVKKQKDWASDPKFTSLNPEAISWVENLPKDLQVEYPEGDAPPWLPNHFVGNIHSYYHLNVVMVHRPQLTSSKTFRAGGSWKKHMEVAITSPDPAFNKDAKEYFTRHMRLMENCTSAWPVPEMQASIDALREAFSADTSQAFCLKSSFPYGSPRAPLRPSEPVETKYHAPFARHSSHEQAAQVHYSSQPLTPPISAGLDTTQSGSMNLGLMPNSYQQGLDMDSLNLDHSEWNPTRIFDQWNTAFPNPAMMSNTTNGSQPSPPIYTPNSIASQDMAHVSESIQQQQQQYPMQTTMPPLQQVQPSPSYASTAPSFVTPNMWRDTVANTYDPGGMKRRWEMDSSHLIEIVSPKRVR
ncbi:MAG: hypothetical protein Q9210_004320 [Variospora velana]